MSANDDDHSDSASDDATAAFVQQMYKGYTSEVGTAELKGFADNTVGPGSIRPGLNVKHYHSLGKEQRAQYVF